MGSHARRVALMGATGSIGTQTLDVLRKEPDQLQLVAISAGRRLSELAAIANEFRVPAVAVRSSDDARALTAMLDRASTTVVVGDDGLEQLSADADVVVNAVVGFAGLPVTMATLTAGRRLALANKESLIAAAPLVAAVRERGDIVPIDSEHCALHQCLASSTLPGHPDVRQLLLTASGGPFRGYSAAQLEHVTVSDALAHPTWRMGAKITVDSSTLMNKGLEVLEARALFDVDLDRIGVVVHPQSIVHSMVEYVDGSTIAQLSRPDMRLPIAYALGLPERFAHGWGALRFNEAFTLEFEPPDEKNFPALALAYDAGRRGNGAPAWLSAANEIAVQAFLDGKLPWRDIVTVVADVLGVYNDEPIGSLDELRESDARARRLAQERIGQLSP